MPCSAVYDTTDLWNDPHLQAREFIQRIEHPVVGAVELMRNPIRMSASEVPLGPSPMLGDSTSEVLRADLGLDDEEIAALESGGAIRVAK